MAPALLMQRWGRFAGLEREGETKRPEGEAVEKFFCAAARIK